MADKIVIDNHRFSSYTLANAVKYAWKSYPKTVAVAPVHSLESLAASLECRKSEVTNKRNVRLGPAWFSQIKQPIHRTFVLSLDEIGLFEGAYKCAMHSISTSVFIGSSLTATQVRHYERPISEGSFGTKSKIFPRLE